MESGTGIGGGIEAAKLGTGGLALAIFCFVFPYINFLLWDRSED